MKPEETKLPIAKDQSELSKFQKTLFTIMQVIMPEIYKTKESSEAFSLMISVILSMATSIDDPQWDLISQNAITAKTKKINELDKIVPEMWKLISEMRKIALKAARESMEAGTPIGKLIEMNAPCGDPNCPNCGSGSDDEDGLPPMTSSGPMLPC